MSAEISFAPKQEIEHAKDSYARGLITLDEFERRAEVEIRAGA